MESFSQQPTALNHPTEDFSVDVEMEDQVTENQIQEQITNEPSQNKVAEATTDSTPEVKQVEVKCSLCHCRLESLLCARDHYEGRRHQKNFMAAIKAKHELFTAMAAGQKPLIFPKVTKKWKDEGAGIVPEDPVSHVAEDPENVPMTGNKKEDQDGDHDGVLMYCFVCDIQVNSNDQALQHYTGRKHKYRSSLVASLPKPSDISEPNLKRKSQVLVSSEQQKADGENKPPVVKKSGGPKASPKPKATIPQQTFSCTMCGVNVTSKDMLEAHLAGSKHRKTMARLGIVTHPIPTKTFVNTAAIPTGNGKTVNTINSNAGTPSTVLCITCEVCSVTMNSQKQFEQHLQSQKHKNRLNSPGGNHTPYKNKGIFGQGGMGNHRKGARKFQQSSYKKFVKGGTTGQNHHSNWSRTNPAQTDGQDWSNSQWPQPGMGMLQGATAMASTTEYHATDGYGYPYEPGRAGPQGAPRFPRPDLKPKVPNTYGQPPPPPTYMTYTEENYHSL